MSKRNYERLDIYRFGSHLLDSGDLDPVYIMLHKAELPIPQLKRWLLAYWCLYHCGAASWLSEREGAEFWSKLLDAAANTPNSCPAGDRWPRGHERRHFRGGAAVTAVRSYREQFPLAEMMVEYIVGPADNFVSPRKFWQVSERAQQFALFGPWMSFKVCDMLDRVLGVSVDFDKAAVFMFADPKKAAFMFWQKYHDLPQSAHPKNLGAEKQVIDGVVAHLCDYFKGYMAPPLNDRPVGLQEIETILCKWKSSMNGHYPLYNDIDEIGVGLDGWGNTALLLKNYLPKGSK